MLPERSYRAVSAGRDFGVQVTDLTFEIDQQSGEHLAAKVLSKGQIAYCKIALDEAIPCDPESETEPRPVVLFLMRQALRSSASALSISPFAGRPISPGTRPKSISPHGPEFTATSPV